MTKILLVLFCLLLPRPDVPLLESGRGTDLRQQATASNEVKVISYNIRWRSGDDLKKLLEVLRTDIEVGGASILGLQEVDRRKKRTGYHNTVKQIADELGMHYVWAAPPAPKPTHEEETGVAILSFYPLSDVQRIVLPHAGPNSRRRVALGATVEIEKRHWRVYSAHAETRLAFGKKLEQYQAVLDDLARYPSDMPAIVMGDFNTWEPTGHGKVSKLFAKAGMTTPFGSEKTFKRRVLFVPIELRLDWVWLRGLETASFGIGRNIEVSDHWPLWTTVRATKKAQKSQREILPLTTRSDLPLMIFD